MNYIGKFISNFKDFYNEINAATLTGAIDVVVVRQEDGSYLSSPFHVRFGKMGVLRSREKVVDIEINGEPVDIHMKLGDSGEAFFVEELEEGDEVSAMLGTSPLPASKFKSFREDDQRSQDSGVEAEDTSAVNMKEPIPALSYPSEESTKELPKTSENNEDQTCSANDPDVGVVRLARRRVEDLPQTKEEGLQVDMEEMFPSCRNKEEEEEEDDNASSHSSGTVKTDLKTRFKLQSTRDIKTDSEAVVKTPTSKSIRRKRKKRNNGRKRSKNSGNQSSDTSTTSEVADVTSLETGTPTNTTAVESIFAMEDIESNESQDITDLVSSTPMVSSTSMPLLHIRSKTEDKDTDWRCALSRSMGPYSHPFSDTDLSPPSSPSSSRPPTPIKSDTEYEVERQKNELTSGDNHTDAKWSWQWGQLPTPPPKMPASRKNSKCHNNDLPLTDSDQESNTQNQNNNAGNEDKSVLGSMLSFMRYTKKARHNPESEGIYLDDLKPDQLDPEVAALYFPRKFKAPEKSTLYTGFQTVGAKDEDVESGNGPSLPHSPHSVEGAIGGPKVHTDSESEDPRHPIFDYKGYHDLAFSRCGSLHEHADDIFPDSLFMQSVVTYDEFCENPTVMNNPDLVVRLGGRYLNWATASSQIMSLVLYQRPLPQKVIDELEKEHMPKKEIRKRTESKGYSWFSWGRGGNQNQAEEAEKPKKTDSTEENGIKPESITPTNASSTDQQDDALQGIYEVTNAETQTSPEDFVRKEHGRQRNDSSESEDLDDNKRSSKLNAERYKKSLRLTKEQIIKLNLKDGSNEGVFSVTTAYQGTTRCKCHIFLWNYDDKIVVSDIDGTITKSDVLGHILPILGKDWAQSGVAQLFSKIRNNGYHFLYLSARAIGQARITRDYLKSIKQGDLSLPAGPLLLNPTSLVNALHREVIEKKPEEFKISCLTDIQDLFPDRNPFYAGYGNKINDVYSYMNVGIPMSRIFTINHRGELRHELTQVFQSSYENLCDIAHHMFPPTSIDDTLEFSSLQYWRPPLPDVTDEIDAMLAEENKKGGK